MSINTQADGEGCPDFFSVCSVDQVDDLEKEANGWGVNRRIAFAIAAKNRFELTEAVRSLAKTDEDAFCEMLDGVRGLIEHYQRSLELFAAVEARLFVAAHDAFDMPFD